ncbi:MAG: OmpA family protein [Myxococcales bacterium]|nr:OmpA family protein [Myxococcales bacterium]
MGESGLSPCLHCRRHVRTDESRCPFCSVELPVRSVAPYTLPRLSRAAQTALHLVFGAALPFACATASSEVAAKDPAAVGSSSASTAPSTSSAPPPSASVSTSASTSVWAVPSAVPIYGSNQIVILVIVQHPVGSAKIEKASDPVVDAVGATLKDHKELYVRVVGHAELVEGKDATARLALAQKRADAVVAALVAQGVDPKRLRAEAAATPPTSGKSENRVQNRATSFVVTDADGKPLGGPMGG